METDKPKTKSNSISAVGRRKESVARVRLTPGQGLMTVNGKPVGEYFAGAILQKLYNRPLEVTKTTGKYTITVKVEGGGQVSQLKALIHGIARALVKSDAQLKPVLKKEGFITRDARVKERRKFGHAQKARAMKQSPKR